MVADPSPIERDYVFRLLGRFDCRRGGEVVRWPKKTRELVSYLLLFRDRPHHREVLAEALWGSVQGDARKYLRQSLWELPELTEPHAGNGPLVHTDPEWIWVEEGSLWLDVAEFEGAIVPVRGKPGEHLEQAEATKLQSALSFYQGDLLEGFYAEWCLFERERLKAVYLAALEKLLGYCEVRGAAEEGLAYGQELLRHDRAHERAHWRMMRLHYLRGERTAALRQFESCRVALSNELGVEPAESTQLLYRQIRDDLGMDPLGRNSASALRGASGILAEQLREVRRTIVDASGLLGRAIATAEQRRGSVARREGCGRGQKDATADAEQTPSDTND